MKRLLPLLASLCLVGCGDLGLDDTSTPTDQTATPAPPSLSQPPAEALMPAPTPDQPPAPAAPQPAETAMAAPPAPPPGDRTCADFLFYQDGQAGVASVISDPFSITTAADGGDPLTFHDAGRDMGVQGAMSVRIADKIFIKVEQAYPRFEIYYISDSENPIHLQTFGADGKLQHTHILAAFPAKQLLMQPIPAAPGLRTIVLTDEDKAGLLTKVCAVK